jgi:hypothetical protein
MIFHYKKGNAEQHKELGKKLQSLDDGEYIIDIKKNRPVRSLDANKFYWAVLQIIAIESGHDKDWLHDFYKNEFNAEEVRFHGGEVKRMARSTSNMDTKEFALYLNRVIEHGRSFFGCVIMEQRDFDYAKLMMIKEQYDRVFENYG